MNVIDIFSGGGGLTEGFVMAGYKIIAHVEKDKWACETLKTRIMFHFLKEKNDLKSYNKYIKMSSDYREVDKNREFIYKKYPELKEKINYEVLNYTFGDPKEDNESTDITEIIESIKKSMIFNKVKDIDLIIGGPPCQAYSLVGRGVMKDKVENDKRNYLFRYYKEIVKQFSPKMFVFENVPGIITAKKGSILTAIIEEFKEIGYTLLSGDSKNIKDNVIDCSKLNIPQTRKRVILFGFKSELNYDYPNIKEYKYEFDDITTRAVIGDLPKRKAGEGSYGEILNYPKVEKLTDYQKYIRKDSFGVFLHQTRKHNNRDLMNYHDVILGKSKGKKIMYTDLPNDRRTHKNEEAFLDRYNVHWWDDIPHTILAHLAKDGHYNIHPDINQCRSLTVREAARIQTFPDNYFFEGPRTAQFLQVGNAVPPLLGYMIAKAIKNIRDKKKHKINKYAQIAVNTTKYIIKNGGNPVEIWTKQAKLIFKPESSSIKKVCPKNTFLGLCEEGLIKGIPAGKYTKSIKNKGYALKAIEILKNNKSLINKPNEIWIMINGKEKKSNSQMEVVCELYKHGLLNITYK